MTTPSPVQEDALPTLLLVEDEVLVRLTMAAMLERASFRVIPVSSGEEALQVLASVPEIRAVVTDVRLASGGMSGFDLIHQVRAERPIPVLVVSGRGAPEQDDLPADVYFLAKPVHRATLVQLVRDLIGSEVRPSPIELPVRRPVPQVEHPAGTGFEDAPSHSLTPRQRAVLELLVQGKSNRDIAAALDLAENTVKVHMAAVFKALGVSSRVEALLAGKPLLERMQQRSYEEHAPSRLS